MFIFIFFIFFLRFAFWLCVAMLAVALGLLAGLIALGGSLVSLKSPERGEQWQQAAHTVWGAVMSAANVADNHRRWVLPNKKPAG